MEKLLHERLRNRVAEEPRDILNELGSEFDCAGTGWKGVISAIANEIERSYHPKPVDQYGKPWNFGDACITAEGEEATIVGYRPNGRVFIDLHDEREFARSYASDLKRPDSLEKLRNDMGRYLEKGLFDPEKQYSIALNRLTALIERGA